MRIVPYRKVSDIDILLKEFATTRTPTAQTFFVVPSRRDRDWWKTRSGLHEFGLETQKAVQLCNWEDLYNGLCEFFETRCLRQIDPPDHRLILSHIVEEFVKERGDLLALWPGLARPGFLDILSDDVRELLNEDISVEQLQAAFSDGKPTSQVLPRLYRCYLEYLRDNSLMDSAQIPLASCALLEQEAAEEWARGKSFVFSGFMSFTRGQLRLVRRLEKLFADVIVLKPATQLSNFQDATAQLQGERGEDEPPLGSGTVVSLCASDLSLEPEMIARELALWNVGEGFLSGAWEDATASQVRLASPGSGKISFPGFGVVGMVVPMQRVASYEAALRRYRIPYTLSRGRSIAQTLLGSLLPALWAVWLQGLESYDTALLLAQPCLAGTEFSIDDAIRFGPRGAKNWESYLEYRERNAERREEKKNAKRALKAFKALAKFCRSLEKGASPVGLLSALHGFSSVPGLWLDALSSASMEEPELDECLREIAASVAEVEAKRLALRELQPDLGVAGNISLKGKDAFDYLKNWSEDTLIQPTPPLGGAVTLYTGPPPILASYPVWIMTDATQKNWPGVIRSSPLLEAEERDRMSEVSAYLPSVHDKRVQKEALFRRLIQTGDVLAVVARSATDEEGRPMGATSFLASFITDMKLWNLLETPVFGAGTAASDGSYFPAIEASPDEKTQRFAPVVRLGRTDETSAEREEFSARHRIAASDIYDLLDCPMRYWLRRKAKLRERRLQLLNPVEAGNLTHKIWQTVWKRKMTEGGTAENISLTLLAAEEWARATASEEPYAVFSHILNDKRLERHRKNMEFYLLRLADVQQRTFDRLAESGLRRTALYMEEEVALSYELGGVAFTGRCDRVELFEDRLAVIADYKWGRSGDSEKKLPALASRRYMTTKFDAFRYGIQLSVYALMYVRQHPMHKVAGVGFLGHKDGRVSGTFESPFAECYVPDAKTKKENPDKAPSLEERIAEAEEAMRCAAEIVKSERFEPCYFSDSCRNCDMKGVCRRGELCGETPFDERDEGDGKDDRLAE